MILLFLFLARKFKYCENETILVTLCNETYHRRHVLLFSLASIKGRQVFDDLFVLRDLGHAGILAIEVMLSIFY